MTYLSHKASFHSIEWIAPSNPGIKHLGCSCHEYRTLATGHADAIVAPSPMPWDHAAGLLTLKELGAGAFADYGGVRCFEKNNRMFASADLAVSKRLIPLLN
ncbi:inositol monophosphatase family protein [uncultured Tateyamaria sp.]|uniref:inositol monophosphatase family protein n=1 Tax=uncultured Tateyamaria sp. TaxID=455651 RepID=UPI0026262F3E|nr:inositol monophosphatase family protein [uncultured Tateyamaria sp.]